MSPPDDASRDGGRRCSPRHRTQRSPRPGGVVTPPDSRALAVEAWLRGLAGRLGLEDGLGLEVDLDAVTDDHSAAVDRDVELHPEVLAADLTAGGEPGAGPTPGVAAGAVELEVELHRAGDPAEGQLTVHGIA